MTNALLHFFGGDPIVATLLTCALCVVLAGVWVGINYARTRRRVWLNQRSQQELAAAMALTHALDKRGPTGGEWQKRRTL